MYLACGVAHLIAAKIEYKHPHIESYERYAHERAPAPKKVKGSGGHSANAERKPFIEVKDRLRQQSV